MVYDWLPWREGLADIAWDEVDVVTVEDLELSAYIAGYDASDSAGDDL